jgi:hypothetical protein
LKLFANDQVFIENFQGKVFGFVFQIHFPDLAAGACTYYFDKVERILVNCFLNLLLRIETYLSLIHLISVKHFVLQKSERGFEKRIKILVRAL